MAGWYIGEGLTVVLVVPVVILLLHRLLAPIKEINRHADDILEHAVGLSGNLVAVPKLIKTQQLTATALEGVAAYGACLAELL